MAKCATGSWQADRQTMFAAFRHARQGGGHLEKLQNLKDHICSWDNLLCAYKEAARDKRYRNEVITFSFHLE